MSDEDNFRSRQRQYGVHGFGLMLAANEPGGLPSDRFHGVPCADAGALVRGAAQQTASYLGALVAAFQ